MTEGFGDVLRRTGVLGLAIAVALALAVFQLVQALVYAGPMVLIGKAVDSLSFRIHGTDFQYHDVLAGLLTVVLVTATLVLVWKLRSGETRRCPDCLSEIPLRANVCRYCTSEVGPSS